MGKFKGYSLHGKIGKLSVPDHPRFLDCGKNAKGALMFRVPDIEYGSSCGDYQPEGFLSTNFETLESLMESDCSIGSEFESACSIARCYFEDKGMKQEAEEWMWFWKDNQK